MAIIVHANGDGDPDKIALLVHQAINLDFKEQITMGCKKFQTSPQINFADGSNVKLTIIGGQHHLYVNASPDVVTEELEEQSQFGIVGRVFPAFLARRTKSTQYARRYGVYQSESKWFDLSDEVPSNTVVVLDYNLGEKYSAQKQPVGDIYDFDDNIPDTKNVSDNTTMSLIEFAELISMTNYDVKVKYTLGKEESHFPEITWGNEVYVQQSSWSPFKTDPKNAIMYDTTFWTTTVYVIGSISVSTGKRTVSNYDGALSYVDPDLTSFASENGFSGAVGAWSTKQNDTTDYDIGNVKLTKKTSFATANVTGSLPYKRTTGNADMYSLWGLSPSAPYSYGKETYHGWQGWPFMSRLDIDNGQDFSYDTTEDVPGGPGWYIEKFEEIGEVVAHGCFDGGSANSFGINSGETFQSITAYATVDSKFLFVRGSGDVDGTSKWEWKNFEFNLNGTSYALDLGDKCYPSLGDIRIYDYGRAVIFSYMIRDHDAGTNKAYHVNMFINDGGGWSRKERVFDAQGDSMQISADGESFDLGINPHLLFVSEDGNCLAHIKS